MDRVLSRTHRVEICDTRSGFGTDDKALLTPFGQEEAAHLSVVNHGGKVEVQFVHIGNPLRHGKRTVTGSATVGMNVQISVIGLTRSVVGVEEGELIFGCGQYAMGVGGIGLPCLIMRFQIIGSIGGRGGKMSAKFRKTVKFAIFKLDVLTIGDLYTIQQGLPKPTIPNITLDRIISLLPNAFTIALLAAIESLLSCVVSDKMIDDQHNSNTELIAQGLGNIASGIFGGIPATGAIARTSANVKNGGRSPISGIVHALVLLLVLLCLMPLAAYIPMPVIAAVLLMVAYNMCEYKHFIKICKTKIVGDIIVLVMTFVLTIVFDLVVAIGVGLVIHVWFKFVNFVLNNNKK